MNSSVDIFWPEKQAPDIEEVKFSFSFCKQKSYEFVKSAALNISWFDYSENQTVADILSMTDAECIFLSTYSELLISRPAIENLLAAARMGKEYSVFVPVFNETDFPVQLAALKAPYLNITTFIETSQYISQQYDGELLPAERCDPKCLLVRRELLMKTDPKCNITGLCFSIGNMEEKSIAVVKSAFIHCFGKYYEADRQDLVNLVPSHVKNVLDVGCARGGYGKHLKKLRPELHLTGVELNPVMAETARCFYDEIITCPIENIRFKNTFDLINCGDVIEHLINPWDMLKRFYDLLQINGYLVLSVPNVGHWTVVRDLLKGKFQYIPVGVLCLTHVRWFTEISVREALQDAGFIIDSYQRQQLLPTPEGLVFIENMCNNGYGDRESLLSNEFIIRAMKK